MDGCRVDLSPVEILAVRVFCIYSRISKTIGDIIKGVEFCPGLDSVGYRQDNSISQDFDSTWKVLCIYNARHYIQSIPVIAHSCRHGYTEVGCVHEIRMQIDIYFIRGRMVKTYPWDHDFIWWEILAKWAVFELRRKLVGGCKRSGSASRRQASLKLTKRLLQYHKCTPWQKSYRRYFRQQYNWSIKLVYWLRISVGQIHSIHSNLMNAHRSKNSRK